MFSGPDILLASSYIGYLPYMSPEVASLKGNEKYDVYKADSTLIIAMLSVTEAIAVWAVGMLIFELLTGSKSRRSLREIADGERPQLPSSTYTNTNLGTDRLRTLA